MSEIAYLDNYYELERITWYTKFSPKFYLILNIFTQPWSASSDTSSEFGLLILFDSFVISELVIFLVVGERQAEKYAVMVFLTLSIW